MFMHDHLRYRLLVEEGRVYYTHRDSSFEVLWALVGACAKAGLPSKVLLSQGACTPGLQGLGAAPILEPAEAVRQEAC